MRKLIFSISITLDGCCDHSKQFADDEMHDYFTGLLRESGLLVYGRTTYQLMVAFWPDAAKQQNLSRALNEFAVAFASLPIVVFSRTLDRAGGANAAANATIVRSGLREEILRLKQEPGKDSLTGGVSVPTQLVELGLVDEYRFVVGPVIAGAGRRLLDGASLAESLRLKLLEVKRFQSGAVALRYAKR